MILYNASTSNGLRNFTRFLTNSNTTTYSDADLDAAINSYYDLFCTEILDAMDDWDFGAEIATTDLVANQQEYSFPSDILKIKRMEITYDGTNWYEVTSLDVNERSSTADSTSVAADFDQSEPFYDLMDDSLMLYPIPTAAVSDGLKIWYSKLPTELSSVTSEPNFARPFHKGLAYGAAKDFFEKYLDKEGNATKMKNADTNIEKTIARMKAFYRKRHQDRKYIIGTYFADYDYGQE